MREHGYERSMEVFSPEEMKEVLKNPGYLPTREEIAYAFTGQKDAFEKASNEDIDEGSETHFDKESWEGSFNQQVKFVEFCNDQKNPTYEFLNEEYLNDLSVYLSERIKSLAKDGEPLTIIEAGAGNGRLTHFLKQKLEEKIPGKFRIIATDSGEWDIKTSFPVEKLSHENALKKYKPQIVIFSWMPYEEDYTADFRTAESVEEYILIGEAGGCCGDEEPTWRNHFETSTGNPPYKKDVFNRKNLHDMSNNQFCRSDWFDFAGFGKYSTVSFRREKIPQIPLLKKHGRRDDRRLAETTISP